MIASCDTPGLLPISQALEAMLSTVESITDNESLTLLQANKRILAEDIISPINVPPADNSAMDGYALRAENLQHQDSLELIGASMAGTPFVGEIASGQCVRIMTGAIIPEGADAVVMQENTETLGNSVKFKQKPKIGNSIRRAGEDITAGSVVLEQGCRLRPAHLSLLASVGIPEVSVLRKIKVGLIATGDELTPPGETLQKGRIYESNRYALHALLSEMGAEVVDFGIVKDDINSIQKAFIQADERCDMVISSGGVSVGDADYVKEVLEQIGQINFWKVAIKPGKPFAFGKLKKAWFCGLPGNPVSSYVTFQQLVIPILRKIAGEKVLENVDDNQYFIAQAATNIRKRPGRTDFQRGIFYRDNKDKLWVKPNGEQGSGIMSSIAHANCYIVLAQNASDVAEGQEVRIQPFSKL